MIIIMFKMGAHFEVLKLNEMAMKHAAKIPTILSDLAVQEEKVDSCL